MDEKDAQKTAFITPWGVYHYRVMPFGLKSAGATYIRAITAIFHDIMHREIEAYVDDVVIKSRVGNDHLEHLRKFFDRLRKYDLKLNPAKYAFGVPAEKFEDNGPPKNEKIIPYVGLVQRPADRFQEVKFKHIPRTKNEFADALATIASMIQHPDSKYIDTVRVEIRYQPAHCAFIEAEIDGKPWYVDIKMYLDKGEYPEGITINQKKTIRKLANGFFLNNNVLYKRTPDLGLLRCVDSVEATRLIEEVHAGTCGAHMNGFVLVKKIVRTGYY
ncbi:uncharacterized protein LOC132041532 [Lycium ferocissimum]|uniref:uncharacterized protein LOC132041532 n=1 Tax=Lycium ferocissimum TaxID=112874 RepID=UPI002816756A|nr:uncharacterized protein LOC132041532 [Lycium ferocissimum]